jgi:cytoskeletal protein RodZ
VAEIGAEDREAPDADLRASVGSLLAAARIDAGLSIEDVATRFNLRPSFVTAVEEGRGDDHMDWSYERNHIRAIATMLAVDLPEGFYEVLG